MSNGNDINASIPAGDLQLYDNYVPALEAGNYFITANQTLMNGSSQVNSNPISTTQELIVSAPQFTLDPTQIINMYPPPGSTGLYGEVLPHIVFNDPTLIWERAMTTTATPWLALMVFEESELTDGDDPDTKSTQITISSFLNTAAPILAPKPVKEDDIDGNTSCRYINMSVATFQALAPFLDELPYLSHIRKVNTGDRAMMGLNEQGIFSVAASNRFAAAPGTLMPKPLKNIVHLVSLEGMDTYLSPQADLSAYTSVSLVSLISWSFLSLPDLAQDFRALATNLVSQETTSDTKIDPSMLWLRLPAPTVGTGASMTEVNKRIADGYVPLAYHTRSGENTFAWYRGPLSPVLTQSLNNALPFYTADAALIYDKTYGIFDVSLASAWEAGREAALADSSFGQKLLEFRNKTHQLTDSLLHRLNSDHFTASQIEQVESTTTVQDMFLSLLTPQLIKDIGATTSKSAGVNNRVTPSPSPTDPVADAKAFLAEPAVQSKMQALISTDIAPVAEWLANFMLLYPLPFDNLVPDQRMLPVESLRFFYFDQNWLSAGLDGAMSLGLDSSRQTFLSEVTKGLLYNAAMQALGVIRAKLEGNPISGNPNPPTVLSGFLLRSALVSGWPNLAIRAKDASDNSLKILRMDHLSSSVLLCVFDGVPNNIELSQPQESLGFGVDDDGNVVLRNILAGGAIGQQIGTLQIRDLTSNKQLCMRSATSRVLNIAPDSPTGLIQSLIAGLKQNGSEPSGGTLGPATFAIQLIKSAEAIVFSSQTT